MLSIRLRQGIRYRNSFFRDLVPESLPVECSVFLEISELRNGNEMERKRIFVDGMESVSLTDGMIRMELYNVLLNRSRNPDAPSEHDITGELIMTPQGFIKAFSTMENLVRKLENAGIIKRNAESNDTAESSANLSPNF